ncbi:DUF3152 domain-containing protein [Lentzea kristufekii]
MQRQGRGGVELPGGPNGFGHIVHGVLTHPKSWIGSGEHAFQRVASSDADFRVCLVSVDLPRFCLGCCDTG